jgi:hypothetical protein
MTAFIAMSAHAGQFENGGLHPTQPIPISFEAVGFGGKTGSRRPRAGLPLSADSGRAAPRGREAKFDPNHTFGSLMIQLHGACRLAPARVEGSAVFQAIQIPRHFLEQGNAAG